MPRAPTKLTEKQVAEVETLAAFLSLEQIGDYFGLTGRAMHLIMDRDPAVRSAYKRGRSKAVGRVAQGLLQRALAGDTASAIFYLKTQARWREKDGPEEAVARWEAAGRKAAVTKEEAEALITHHGIVAGDVRALQAWLAAQDPVRWGGKGPSDDAAEGDDVRPLDWVPALPGEGDAGD